MSILSNWLTDLIQSQSKSQWVLGRNRPTDGNAKNLEQPKQRGEKQSWRAPSDFKASYKSRVIKTMWNYCKEKNYSMEQHGEFRNIPTHIWTTDFQ